MKVGIAYRGSIGDMCLWMTKFKGFFKEHSEDEKIIILNSRYSLEQTLGLACLNPEFNEFYHEYPNNIISVPYHMPMKKVLLNGCAIQYIFDVWNGGWRSPVSELYPVLGYDTYPVNLLNKNQTKNVVINPYGYYIKDTWTKENWKELFFLFINNGYKVIPVGDEFISFATLKNLVETIRSSCLWIGIDTGSRNIALIYQVPVIELGTPGKGNPNYNVFHPKEYRNRSKYYPDIDRLTPGDVFETAKELL